MASMAMRRRAADLGEARKNCIYPHKCVDPLPIATHSHLSAGTLSRDRSKTDLYQLRLWLDISPPSIICLSVPLNPIDFSRNSHTRVTIPPTQPSTRLTSQTQLLPTPKAHNPAQSITPDLESEGHRNRNKTRRRRAASSIIYSRDDTFALIPHALPPRSRTVRPSSALSHPSSSHTSPPCYSLFRRIGQVDLGDSCPWIITTLIWPPGWSHSKPAEHGRVF